MQYKTLMVHLELSGGNEGILNIAGQLAERFDARVIGIAACQPVSVPFDEGFALEDIVARDRAEISREIAVAEAQFRDALKNRAKALEWRACITARPLVDYIASEARAADLVITGKDIGPKLFDQTRRVPMGDLVMRCGRPILLVPPGVDTLAFRHVFVGWKETREARRAVADALPLLKLAGRSTVVEVTDERGENAAKAHLADVTSWLAMHQISATPHVAVAAGAGADYLRGFLRDRKCDLMIAGAYGHNRLSEWFYGGVTYDLLLDPDFCVLISH